MNVCEERDKETGECRVIVCGTAVGAMGKNRSSVRFMEPPRFFLDVAESFKGVLHGYATCFVALRVTSVLA
jgi:hypothetical protein